MNVESLAHMILMAETLHLLFITVYLHYSIGDRKAVVLL